MSKGKPTTILAEPAVDIRPKGLGCQAGAQDSIDLRQGSGSMPRCRGSRTNHALSEGLSTSALEAHSPATSHLPKRPPHSRPSGCCCRRRRPCRRRHLESRRWSCFVRCAWVTTGCSSNVMNPAQGAQRWAARLGGCRQLRAPWAGHRGIVSCLIAMQCSERSFTAQAQQA